MPQIRVTHLADGRTIEYYPDRLESGGILTEPFYLCQTFEDIDIRLWIRTHKCIRFINFTVGAVLVGQRSISSEELKALLLDATSSQDQFYDQALQIAEEN